MSSLSLSAQTVEVAALHRAFAEIGLRHEPDITATQQLALLYGEGRLVSGDLVVACGLFRFALGLAGGRYPPDHTAVIEAERLANEYCLRIGYADVQEATSWMVCPQFGIQSEVITLEPGYWIELVRRRVRIHSPRGTFDRERIVGGGCLRNLALTRYTRVEPPPGTNVPPRHLIESVSWLSYVQDGKPLRQVQWLVEEVKGDNFTIAAIEDLFTEPGSAWPAPEVPPEVQDGVTFRMKQDRKVEYQIGGRFQRRGSID